MRMPMKALDWALSSKRPLLVQDLEIPYRTFNALVNGAGLVTVNELCQRSQREILGLNRIGRISLEEIKEALAAKGHYLGQYRADGTDRDLPPYEQEDCL